MSLDVTGQRPISCPEYRRDSSPRRLSCCSGIPDGKNCDEGRENRAGLRAKDPLGHLHPGAC